MKQDPHIIVVGGGHAGCEAAYAAARMAARVTLVTMQADNLGVMSCNPAMGGLGKGHLIREVDAMGGLMGVAADSAAIQYRLLNRSKGPAVQGPRAQIDRDLYKGAVQAIILQVSTISVVEGQVTDLLVEHGKISGVTLEDGDIRADAVILTTGTFLNGVMHVGDRMEPGGRAGERPAERLATRLYDMSLPMGRLKTGTPPRIRSSSIDWASLEMQPGDPDPVMLSFQATSPLQDQVACGITHTNVRTHEIIRENLHRSAMYSGNISGAGPRYCPSIEDKVGRFADKESHQIFLEPEGLTSDLVYPNGISTSLPIEVQYDYIRSIAGLASCEIVQPGYAIEYDYVDPRALSRSLMLRDLPGLYLAGQINGTTGYEEAAAQGLLAGINAVLEVRGADPVILDRAQAYIGVMADDLTANGATEPYRMFTSRAEFRLSLRADNADQRLSPLAISLGLLSPTRAEEFERKRDALDKLSCRLRSTHIGSRAARAAGANVSDDGKSRSAYDLLSIPGVTTEILGRLADLADADSVTVHQVAKDALYARYIDRQKDEIAALRRDESTPIPDGFDFEAVPSLSAELRVKLAERRPESIARASKIEGMTPAALNALLFRLKKIDKTRAA